MTCPVAADSPPIDVVVIAYNQAEYIATALDSVLSQTVRAAIGEIVVVDDASSDATAEIVARHARQHSALRLIARDKNSGGCAAPRNDGIRATRAPWIAFLDGDDIWLPSKIATDLACLTRWPEAGLIYSDYTAFDESTGREHPVRTCRYTVRDRDQLARFFVNGGPIAPSCTVIRRTVLDKVGLFDPEMKFNEDSELWHRIAGAAPLQHTGGMTLRKREWLGSLGSARYGLENLAAKREITRRMVARHPELARIVPQRDAAIALKTAVHQLATGATGSARASLRQACAQDPGNLKAQIYRLLMHLPGPPTAYLGLARRLRTVALGVFR